MRIGIMTGATGAVVELPSLIHEVVQAEEDGFDSFWLPQVSAGPGFDALTAKVDAFQRGVDVRDVRVVMFAVMDFHRFRVDVGLEGVMGEAQVR